MNTVRIIVDLQYGSTGKGLLAGYLATRFQPDTVVAAWAPNAGHTFIDAAGRKFINIALPNGIVSRKLKRVMIGPGSVIDPERLMAEIESYSDLLHNARIMVHENAAVVTERHRELEKVTMVGIGSTMKGVGEAVIQKIRRSTNHKLNNTAIIALADTPLARFVVTSDEYDKAIDESEEMLVEGAQGFSLGINSGFYPYTTSRECTTAQILSDCAVPMRRHGQKFVVYGSARTFPIRVANRYDGGRMVGYSGPCYPDQREISWDDIGVQPELTTVTKLPRRIFTFSYSQVQRAVRMNAVNQIFLNFVNYLPQAPYNPTSYVNSPRALDMVRAINASVNDGTPYPPIVTLLGTGPTINDIRD